ncbi:membrane protein insertion efficiency factor YidD [Candidatus Saccharibacteria bacterium]|nr:membrane protein insertion efficiency factor YidD [Candidatus Saccharibacteria bacterium]MCB9834576.1 membrane protein insertion efficiency factor YidD [Candidatus Nomurabacteria bacterium]
MVANKLAIRLIKVYQATLSPDHGLMKFRYPFGYCSSPETCSEYGLRQYQEQGFLRATINTTKKIISCNPLEGRKNNG